MANERLGHVVASLVGLAAGLVGGLFLGPPTAEPRELAQPWPAVGRIYWIDGETYVDGAFIEFLRPRVDAHQAASGIWTVFQFSNLGLFVQSFHDSSLLLPGQRGPLYMVRHVFGSTIHAINDKEAHSLLQDMVDLGLLELGGTFRSWGEVYDGGKSGV